jgi:hypothetical protein
MPLLPPGDGRRVSDLSRPRLQNKGDFPPPLVQGKWG